MTTKVALLFLTSVFTVGLGKSSVPNAPSSCAQLRLDPLKPTVFISAETNSRRASVTLRIHNNSSLPIHFPVQCDQSHTDTPSNKHIVPLYRIDRPIGSFGPNMGGDVVCSYWLAASEQVTFLVPKARLTRGKILYVPFDYQWELKPFVPGEPAHFLIVTYDMVRELK